MEKQVKILQVEPGKDPEVVTIDNTLEAFQKVVGGYLESIPLPGFKAFENIMLLANEDGLYKNLPINRIGIVGTFLFTKIDHKGNHISLSESESLLLIQLLLGY